MFTELKNLWPLCYLCDLKVIVKVNVNVRLAAYSPLIALLTPSSLGRTAGNQAENISCHKSAHLPLKITIYHHTHIIAIPLFQKLSHEDQFRLPLYKNRQFSAIHQFCY